MQEIIDNFFNAEIARQMLPFMWTGLKTTLLLCVSIVPLGIVVGALVAVLYATGFRPLRLLVICYVDFFRSIPPLMLLVFVYFGLPFVGIDVPAMVAIVFAFTLNTSSYYGEIFRAGIESIGRGQWEAARSTGLSWTQAMRFVVLPQATRNVAPDLTGNTLEAIKATSLASVVAETELLRQAQLAQGLVFNPTPLVMAAGIYLLMLWPLVRVLSRMQYGMAARRSG